MVIVDVGEAEGLGVVDKRGVGVQDRQEAQPQLQHMVLWCHRVHIRNHMKTGRKSYGLTDLWREKKIEK